MATVLTVYFTANNDGLCAACRAQHHEVCVGAHFYPLGRRTAGELDTPQGMRGKDIAATDQEHFMQ